MGEIAVRPAAPDDEDAVLDLIEELFAPPGARPPGYTRARGSQGVRHVLERDDADVLLAVDGNAAVGLSSVYVDFRSIRFGLRCYLMDLVVTPGRRGRGIGARLLSASIAWARDRGCDVLALDSGNGRKDAHRFYVAQGMDQGSLNFTVGVERSP